MVVKTIFLVSRGHFWRINFLFHKIFKFFICFQTLRKTFRIFGENNLVGLSKLFSSVQGIFLEEFFLKQIRWIVFHFWSSVTNFWTFGENFAIALSKLHSLCQLEIFDWTVFSTKIYEFFHRLRVLRKRFWHFGEKASKSVSKCNSCGQKNCVENLIFEEKTFAFFSSTDQKFCGPLSKNVE